VASRSPSVHSLSLVHIGAVIANSVYGAFSRVLLDPVRLELKSVKIWARNTRKRYGHSR
jgi:hypothetical protein